MLFKEFFFVIVVLVKESLLEKNNILLNLIFYLKKICEAVFITALSIALYIKKNTSNYLLLIDFLKMGRVI